MRTIGPEWRSLAEGLLSIENLDARFREEWGPRLEVARRKRYEAELQRLRGRGRAALMAASALALALCAVTLILLLFVPLEAAAKVFFLALLVLTILGLHGVWALLATPSPDPAPSGLSGRWWGTISGRTSSARRPGPALAARGYGDEGEEALVSYLSGALPGGYVALRGPLVARNLDADLIVAGPTGVWVLEVKHWTGYITCRRGEWRREKSYRQPGGRLVREVQALRPFDGQWAKEASAVQEALRLGLPGRPDLHKAVGGGLVFTHGGGSFSVDASCKALAFIPRTCAGYISGAPEVPAFTMEERLRVLDILIERSDLLHEQQGEPPWATSSAVELARRLHHDAVSRASSYVSDVSATGEEAGGTKSRAVYHPHPDDPPPN